MSIEKLEHFIAVVKCGTFVRAADMLHLHQSTLSKSIASLESLLDVQLIVYQNGRMTLTNAGERLYADAPAVVSSYHRLLHTVRHLPDELGGTLSFCYQAFLIPALNDAYGRFSTLHPGVQWSADVYARKDSSKIEDSVVGNIHDLGIVSTIHYAGANPLLDSAALHTCPFVLLTARNSPLAERQRVSLLELAGLRFLMCRTMHPEIYEYLNDLLAQQGLLPVEVVYVDRDLEQLSWDEFLFMQVRSNLGITIVPQIIGQHFASECAMVDLVDFPSVFEVRAIWRRDNPNPALQQFVKLLHRQNAGAY